jgi:hypothetical protein
MDPYLIKGRKINMRIYLLLKCNQEQHTMNAYVYNDGLIKYTRTKFSNTIINHDTQITDGLIERSIFKTHPLTISDLCHDYLIDQERKNTLWNNIVNLFVDVTQSYRTITDINEFDGGKNHFIILGCDIAPDKKLNMKLIEINKGPNLVEKDKKESFLKCNMFKQALITIGFINSDSTSDIKKIKNFGNYGMIPTFIKVL